MLVYSPSHVIGPKCCHVGASLLILQLLLGNTTVFFPKGSHLNLFSCVRQTTFKWSASLSYTVKQVSQKVTQS